MTALSVLATLCAGLLLVPALVLLAECLLAVTPRARACRLPRSATRPRTTVLVPAHDEEQGIAATIEGLLPELGPDDVLLVVADNCRDATAARARASGACVVERRDPARRGKGHALAFGLAHLARGFPRQAPPDVVVVVDADCAVAEGAIEVLARHAAASGRPVQAEYVLRTGDPAAPAALSAVAFALRNRVRLAGLRAAGLPCPLTGSGMAFPFALLERAPLASSHVVEDLHLGLDLALLGSPAASCPDARVVGSLPARADARRTQRRRWEHGHLAAVVSRLPGLVAAAARGRRLDLLGLALDLAVPPASLLVLLLAACAGAGAALAAGGGPALPLALALLGLLCVAVAVAVAWVEACRGVAHPGVLLHAPAYLARKLPLYLELLVRGPERRWVRTARDPDAREPAAATDREPVAATDAEPVAATDGARDPAEGPEGRSPEPSPEPGRRARGGDAAGGLGLATRGRP